MTLEPVDRVKLAGIMLMILISSGLELLGVSAILPLITAVTDSSAISQKWYFIMVQDLFGINDDRWLIVFLSFFLAGVYILKNLYIIWMNAALFRYTTFTQKKMDHCG